MEEIKIIRTGKPHIVFTGELIGQTAKGFPALKIYRTKATKYVAEISHDGGSTVAEKFEKAKDVIEWLQKRLSTTFPQTQAAIEQASEKDDSFRVLWTETVD